MRPARLTFLMLALLPLTACGSTEPESTAAGPRAVSGTLVAGQAIPTPKDDVVLKITGTPKGNAKKNVLALDLPTLRKLPHIKATVHEPFLKRDVPFEGVRIEDLLRIAGVPDARERIYMHALDDYQVTFDRAELVSGKAVLATSIDGKPIEIADGGPIRVVFLGNNDVASNTDMWIWSVDRIEARR